MRICLLCLCYGWLFSPLIAQELPAKDRAEILSVFSQQEQCWNNGDINCFMEGYWRSDSLLFIGSNGVNQGWKETLARYQRSYPDRATMGKLSFTILKLHRLGKKAAFVLGKWHLKREIGDVGGYFTLIWRKIQGRWVIVSDHTS